MKTLIRWRLYWRLSKSERSTVMLLKRLHTRQLNSLLDRTEGCPDLSLNVPATSYEDLTPPVVEYLKLCSFGRYTMTSVEVSAGKCIPGVIVSKVTAR